MEIDKRFAARFSESTIVINRFGREELLLHHDLASNSRCEVESLNRWFLSAACELLGEAIGTTELSHRFGS